MSALRTLISLTPGLGARELNGELERLGERPATLADLRAIGGYVEADGTGVWALAPEARSCSTETRIARGLQMEALSHRFRALGYAAWQAERNRLILGWVRADARAALRMAA